MVPCAVARSFRLKQCAVIEFLTAEGVTPKEIYRRMQIVYGDCVDVSTVRRWASKSKDTDAGTSDLRDKQRVGRPVTATNEFHRDTVDRLIQDDRRITQLAIASQIGISKERVGHIIALLGYRKICARWVPRMPTPEMKAQRLEICQELLTRYENEGEAFLHAIVTGDETWVHYYEPEMKL